MFVVTMALGAVYVFIFICDDSYQVTKDLIEKAKNEFKGKQRSLVDLPHFVALQHLRMIESAITVLFQLCGVSAVLTGLITLLRFLNESGTLASFLVRVSNELRIETPLSLMVAIALYAGARRELAAIRTWMSTTD